MTIVTTSDLPTIGAEELADLLGVSTWAIYESVRRGDCPVRPIRVGRRLRWPRKPVMKLLEGETEGPQ